MKRQNVKSGKRVRANLTLDRKLLAQFRKFVSSRHDGTTYGHLKTEAEKALVFYMSSFKQRGHGTAISHTPPVEVGGGAVEAPGA